jgi:hypothetical protein
MLPYIIALITLIVYWYLHAQGVKKVEGMIDWIKQNPKTAAVQVGTMFVVVYFRAVLTPYLALPVVLSITGALLAGTFIDKVAKIIATVRAWFATL